MSSLSNPNSGLVGMNPKKDTPNPILFLTFAAQQNNQMARLCQVTGKKPGTGHKVSFSNKKAKRRFLPNLQSKKFFLAEEDRWITLKVSADAIRTINKNGLLSVVNDLRAQG